MKIYCTQEEKDIFIRALTQNEVCLYTDTKRNLECDWNCQDCYEKSIDWETEKGETALSPILVGDGYFDGELVYDYWHCPKCDQAHDIDDKYNYCPTCGQRIYWETEE